MSESVKKGKLVKKIVFSDSVEWRSNNLWKMMSADVNANINQQEIIDPVANVYNR